MTTRVIVAGVSTRAAAESAARAGFAVTALDAFGDLDQQPSVRALSLSRNFGMRFTAHAAARASRTIDGDVVAYLSNFENHPRAVERLAAGRALWGNPPDVLRNVRDPVLVATVLQRADMVVPRVGPPARDGEWLVKPIRSGGGIGVRAWRGEALPRACYLQEFIDGIPASIVFVAAGGRAVPLGISRQLVGGAAFGASGYRYCGNVLAAEGDVAIDPVVNEACALAQASAEEFHLVGVNGIDFVARDGRPYAIEINPRWSSSMELVERAYRISVFGAHAAACESGALPDFDLRTARRAAVTHGKAIVFAREHSVTGDTRSWLDDTNVRDVPHPGEPIATGQPICTVFADGADTAQCEDALAVRAGRIYAELASTGVGSGEFGVENA